MNFPHSPREFEEYKIAAAAFGLTVISKYRKGMKTIKFGDIVLSERQSQRKQVEENQHGE